MSNPLGMPDPPRGGNQWQVHYCATANHLITLTMHINSNKKYFESSNSTNKQQYFVTTVLSNTTETHCCFPDQLLFIKEFLLLTVIEKNVTSRKKRQ